MSVIKNDYNIKSDKKAKKNSYYEIPAVIREEKNEITLEKAIIIALILHPAIIAILLLSSFILKLLGIDLDLFKKPELKPKDIEFVLVEKEAPPINKNTKYRADKNSQAGGKHDPKRPVSLPKAEAPKAAAKKPSAPPAAPQKKEAPKKEIKPQVQQKPQTQPQPQKPAVTKSEPPKPQTPAPKMPAPKPVPTPAAPKPALNPQSKFNIPIPPKSNLPQISQPTAPVTSAPKSTGQNTGMPGSSGPSPKFSPVTSPATSGRPGVGGTPGRFSNTSGNTQGNVGNPGPGNPKGAPGIDAIKEPDFGPYMKELQRRIKMNWDPPKGNESKRVILLFSIARDGRLLNVKVQRSSGLPAADKAALDAVKLTAPFKPLPPEFKGNSVDIQFTFDYNVFGVSG